VGGATIPGSTLVGGSVDVRFTGAVKSSASLVANASRSTLASESPPPFTS